MISRRGVGRGGVAWVVEAWSQRRDTAFGGSLAARGVDFGGDSECERGMGRFVTRQLNKQTCLQRR
jgi:hypothetical protein